MTTTKATVKNTSALTPVTRGQKSYCNRAHVITLSNGVRLLKSYDTIVCGINTRGHFFRLWAGWSATTAKHVDSFVLTYTDRARGINKKEWEAMPIEKWAYKYAEYRYTYTPAYPAPMGFYAMYW